MENVEQRVKKIVAEQLGRKRGGIKERILLHRRRWALIRSIRWSWSWRWRRVRDPRSRMKTRKDHHRPAAIDYVNSHARSLDLPRQGASFSGANFVPPQESVITGLASSPRCNSVAEAWARHSRRPIRHQPE